MGFWFIPSRTDRLDDDDHGDLHPTDVEVYKLFALDKWANGAHVDTGTGQWGWGTSSDERLLSDLLGESFTRYLPDGWAPPAVVRQWGERLQAIARHVGYDASTSFWRYGRFLIALGRRGIGLRLSA